MKRIKTSQLFLSLLGSMFGVVIMGLAFIAVSLVLASPASPPPDGNPPYPAKGPEGPPGKAGIDAISSFRTVELFVTGNQFAAGVTVSCASDEYVVDCSHTCTKGEADTQSWPIDNRTCKGHESDNNTHGGTCTLIAHCLKHN